VFRQCDAGAGKGLRERLDWCGKFRGRRAGGASNSDDARMTLPRVAGMVNAIGARKYSVIGEGLKTGDGIDSGA
jgi:hypothetical protein